MKLTERERLVIDMVTEGMTNGEIAEEMQTTVHVVKNYIRRIYDKTGFSNRVELALWRVKQEFK